jgi:glycosyltransferase involved in cell wall biosynthesis
MTEESIKKTKLPISIVIPTFCEEKALPRLLKSIESQIIGATEIIVADAHSSDRTREIAQQHSCKVVNGGKIAEGRNAGARAATQEYILFLDADTILPTPTVLLEAFTEFLKSKSDIASAGFKPDKEGATGFGLVTTTILFNSWNALRKVQSVTKKLLAEGGAFILTKKEVFDRLKGFDTEIAVSEDLDFFVRAVKLGYVYAHLSQKIYTSTRRYNSPRKATRSLLSSVMQGALLGVGIYAGSALFKRITKSYGRLGGGEGKDPSEVD